MEQFLKGPQNRPQSESRNQPQSQPQNRSRNQPAEDGGSQTTVTSVLSGLEEIDRILHQMLLLSELSASEIQTDRERLQRTLERLQTKIDRIADRLPTQITLNPPGPEDPRPPKA